MIAGNGEVVVLASASASRRALLTNAGVPIEVAPARIDEDEVKNALRAEGAAAAQAAETLAELKAQRASGQRPGRLVVGADQILTCEGAWFDKPRGRAEAAEHLARLSGHRHTLVTSAVVVRDRTRLWHHTAEAQLTMRPLETAFIDLYLDAVGEDACASVGAYQLEGLGAQFFTHIDGDFFTILGLPLLPLLAFLREHGVLAR